MNFNNSSLQKAIMFKAIEEQCQDLALYLIQNNDFSIEEIFQFYSNAAIYDLEKIIKYVDRETKWLKGFDSKPFIKYIFERGIDRMSLRMVKYLIFHNKIEIGNCYFGKNNTFLHLAAYCSSDILNFILGGFEDPDIKNDEGNTPLHFAVSFGSRENIKLLLKKEADPNIMNNKGETCFKYARTAEIVNLLNKRNENNK